MKIIKTILYSVGIIYLIPLFIGSLISVVILLNSTNTISGKLVGVGVCALLTLLFGLLAILCCKKLYSLWHKVPNKSLDNMEPSLLEQTSSPPSSETNLEIPNTHLQETITNVEVPNKNLSQHVLESSSSSSKTNLEISNTHLQETITNVEVPNKNLSQHVLENTIEIPQNIQYVNTGNTLHRTDGKPITDEEVHKLIQIGYESAQQAEKISTNPKFHRTDREEDLSFNFQMKYDDEINNLTEKFESLYDDAYKTNDLTERITLLNEAITAYEKAKKFCYSKGKGGTIYFQDMWEYLYNFDNQWHSYLDNIKKLLEETEYLRDTVIPQIINTIATNDGILQKNIYKFMPDINKSLIQHTLRQLETDSKISRIKKGSSYELHILSPN